MDKNKGLAVDLVLVGQLGNFNLATARNQFPNDPGYRVELLLERGSAAALRDLLEKGPLRDTADVKFPVFGCSATFSTKLKSIVRTDRPRQGIDDPLLFL